MAITRTTLTESIDHYQSCDIGGLELVERDMLVTLAVGFFYVADSHCCEHYLRIMLPLLNKYYWQEHMLLLNERGNLIE